MNRSILLNRTDSLSCDSDDSLVKRALTKNFGLLRLIWEENLGSLTKKTFFLNLVSKTIDACISNDYIKFDAHTTSNCCHGIALLARELLLLIPKLEFRNIQEEILSRLEAKDQKNFAVLFEEFFKSLPDELIMLSSMFLLNTVRNIDAQKRMRTEAKKLKLICNIGVEFCWEITNSLQKFFSNFVANSYESYLDSLQPSIDINGAPIHLWGTYIKRKYIRTDNRGINYASCLFSTQISLAYLISAGAKLALVADIIDSNGEHKDRFVSLFVGDGHQDLKNLSDCSKLVELDTSEPVIVFGGYIHSDNLNQLDLKSHLGPWLTKFPSLMLACDVCYPQFPHAHHDSTFDSSPIIPKESRLRSILCESAKVNGVSIIDPTLFCSSHTYLASLEQVLDALKNQNKSMLPTAFHGLQIPITSLWGRNLLQQLELNPI